MARKGLGIGIGKGYYNLVPIDSHIHSLSAMGVKTVNLEKYKGNWYAQGSIPTFFERNCDKSKANYKLRPDGKVDVLNTCIKKGKDSKIKGVARSVSKDNKNLKVSFFPLIEGDYKIEYLSSDYKYVIVGHPDKKYLWIMARDNNISKEKYKELVDIARKKGYDVSNLKEHTLNAKGSVTEKNSNLQEIKNPKLTILSDKSFNNKFGGEYEDYEIGYATTKIYPDGSTHIYLRDSGDYERNMKLIAHEFNELSIWHNLVNEQGVNPNIADEMAHNLNEVKVDGVSDSYELNANN